VAAAPETTVARAIDHLRVQVRLERQGAGHLERVTVRRLGVTRWCSGCTAAVARLARVVVWPRVRVVCPGTPLTGVEVLVPETL